jgi:carboxyl-terminal processing protease
MLNSLDPFSRYFNTEQWKAMTAESAGEKYGIGASLIPFGDTLVVYNVAANSPAETVGIVSGDRILEISGKSVLKFTSAQANALLEGQSGEDVKIKYKKDYSPELIEKQVKRADYEIPSLSAYRYFESQKCLYIKLARFSAKSVDEIKKLIESIKKNKKIEGFIFDLKGNPGGYLESVRQLCLEFMHKGDTILYTKAKHPDYRYVYTVDKDGEYADIPIVVVVDEESASASEIFAGAMQDLDRGLVVGRQTVGKGLVQKSWTYTDTSAFRITVAKYCTPSGRSVQKPYNIDTNSIIDPALKLTMGDAEYQNLKEAMLKNGGASKMPVYLSRRGRTILGGGGIFPDKIVVADTATLLTETLRSRGVFLEYALNYISAHRGALLKNYSDYQKFAGDFEISDDELSKFVVFFQGKNLWNDKMYVADKERIRNQLKALIAYLLWGDPAYYAVLFNMDKQCQEALKQIDNAKKLIK